MSNLDVLHNLWLHDSSGLVRNGSFLENGTNFYPTYVTDSGFLHIPIFLQM